MGKHELKMKIRKLEKELNQNSYSNRFKDIQELVRKIIFLKSYLKALNHI